MAIGYRGYKAQNTGYGTLQNLQRRSVVLEATKMLFDYHGFVPYVGPAVSFENLNFEEFFENRRVQDITDERISYGITFGWDIRPNRLQTWVLRTNLRWFPDLDLAIADNQSISFDNIEFNFIQWVVYPGRMFGDKMKVK